MLFEGFDGYCATVHANGDALFDDLLCLLESAGLGPVEREGIKTKFYAKAREVVDDKGHQLLLLKSGGSNPHPHLECFGSHSGLVAGYLREFYSHQPTRVDHAIDRGDFGLFDAIHAFALDLCKRHGLRGSPAGDWVTADGGRTFYVGSRASQVFVRIYEKGIKYARDLGEPITDQLRNWVRIELEFKPQTKAAKALAPQIDGPRMWGSTQWTQEMAKAVLGMEAQPVSIRERRESNHERALRYMGVQYGRHLQTLFAACSEDYEEFGYAVAELAGVEPVNPESLDAIGIAMKRRHRPAVQKLLPLSS